jgi:hypothetical protein
LVAEVQIVTKLEPVVQVRHKDLVLMDEGLILDAVVGDLHVLCETKVSHRNAKEEFIVNDLGSR